MFVDAFAMLWDDGSRWPQSKVVVELCLQNGQSSLSLERTRKSKQERHQLIRGFTIPTFDLIWSDHKIQHFSVRKRSRTKNWIQTPNLPHQDRGVGEHSTRPSHNVRIIRRKHSSVR